MKIISLPYVFLLVVISVLVFSDVSPLFAQETITIQPSATLKWDEIVQTDALQPAISQREEAVSPPMPGPPPVAIDIPTTNKSTNVQPPIPYKKQLQKTTPSDISKVSSPPIVNFQALTDDNTVIPPDTHGAVGLSHIMTMLNSQVRVQTKAGSVLSTVSLASFWSSLTGSPFDPKIFYDSLNSRWIAVCGADAGLSTSKVFFAISSTSDPTGSWTFYSFVADAGATSWADYPGVGMNTRWIAITNNMFAISGGAFLGAKMWAIDKSTALAGGALTLTVFPTKFDLSGGVSGFTLQPCITFGTDTTLYIVDNSGVYRTSDTTFLLRLSQITGTGAVPSWSVVPGSSFASSGLFAVTNNFNVTQINAAQLGTATLVNTNDKRILNAVNRNGKIWCTHSAGLPAKIAPAPTRTAVFWYQLNPTAMPSPIVQSGVLDGGTGVHHFFPSIAANTVNDACIGFTRSDASRYAEAVFTGRLAADPINTMQSITVLKTGKSSYSKFFGGGRNRWGDYSATVVDPSDGKTFWHIQEYADSNVGSGVNDGRWGTWWGRIDPLISLPIQLASFDASISENDNVVLYWATVSEVNNYGFFVERRSENALSFQELPNSFVPGNGTTLEPYSYSWKDYHLAPGTYFYRVRQVDLDGNFSYSYGIKVVIDLPLAVGEKKILPKEYKLFNNYPNPFNPNTTLRYDLPERGLVSLKIFDVLGREVATPVNKFQEAGYRSVSFDASNLPSGVYFYKINAGKFSEVKKMLLMR